MTQMMQSHSIRSTCIILPLFIALASCQTNEKTGKDPSCTPPCSCCLDTSPCFSSNGQCSGQCIDGIFSGKCRNKCPTNCIRCTDHPNAATDSSYWGKGYCTECKDGRYATSQLYQCQLECPTECKTCYSYTECTSCKDGYTLDGTMCRQCKTGCALCQSYDICTQCDDGYYNSGGAAYNLSCVACSSGCSIQCDQTSGTCPCRSVSFTGDRCDMCIDGMTGEDCNIPCQTGCATCTRTPRSDCTSCIHGYYLQEIDCVDCSIGCSTQCDQVTGACNCKHGFDGVRCDLCLAHFSGTNCDKCSPGYHGTSCNQACPDHCKQNECARHNGLCTQGCTGNFDGATCSDCVVGWYGQDCSLRCPGNCDGFCNRSSSYCQRCKADFAGNTCDECSVGKHGSDCGLACSLGCKDKQCDRGTGTCDSCKDGRYGEICNRPCSPNCLQKICQQKTGACIGECSTGFSGDMCCLKGSNCKSCLSSSQCVECLSGKYDETCNSQCPANCADNICYKTNGTCNKCTDGFQGHYCTLAMDSSDGTPGAAIGGGVAGGLLVIIVVAVLLIVYWRRQGRICDGPRGSNGQADASGTNTYVNEMRVASNETQDNWKVLQDKTRELEKNKKQQQKYQTQQQKFQQHILRCQQKEAKYAKQAARIQHELDEMNGKQTLNQDSEDGANTGIGNSTYETLDPQTAGDHPYDELGTK